MNSWRHVLDAVTDEYRRIGGSDRDGELERICPVPTLAPEAFVHRLPGPATQEQIARVLSRLPRAPAEYIELLETCNGFSLYCGRLAMYGVQPPLLDRRTAKFIPYNVFSLQVEGNELAVGSVGPNRDRLLIAPDGIVSRVPRSGGLAVGEWRTLRECVLTICQELAKERDWSLFSRK